MRCGYCGREIPDTPGSEAPCGLCPGGCRKVHCPHCGYSNPAPPAFLRRKGSKDDDREDKT